MATHSSILAWKIPWKKSLVGYSQRGHKESDMTERLFFLLSILGMTMTMEVEAHEKLILKQTSLKCCIANQNYIEVHITPVRKAIVKKSTNNKCCKGCRKKESLPYCWQECKLVQPLWKTVWRFLRKLKIELPHDPAILLLGIYSDKTMILKDTCTPMFIAAVVPIAKTWKQPNVH